MHINRDDEKALIAEAIMSYLKIHPNAADTIEGITQWWLPSQQNKASNELVQQALDYLVANSSVKFKTNLSGNKVYSNAKTE